MIATGVGTAPSPRPYPMDNDDRAATEHLAALAEALDPVTTERILRLGSWEGKSCLELGAGGGSIARWLADLVGPTGRVIATDLKPGHIPPHPQLEVVAHDLIGEVPLADRFPGPFDLIHARLLLNHLPTRHTLLADLAALLAPGGLLLIEDWAARRADLVVTAPSPAAGELYTTFQQTIGTVLDSHGTDPTWPYRMHPTMLANGLVNVSTVIRGEYWTGGGAGLRLMTALLAMLRPRLRAAGMTEAQLDQLPGLMADPRLVIHGHPLYSCAGWRR